MPFYTFNPNFVPFYPPPPASSSPQTTKNETSFAFNESFFQVPESLAEPAADNSTVLFVPETQYTPTMASQDNNQLLVNVTADQSIVLPSISSVLEASARSALNYRRKSGHFPAPIHQRVADKLEMPSQNPNSPLLFGSKTGPMDLTDDSLLLALNSSLVVTDENVVDASNKQEFESGNVNGKNNNTNNILDHAKFSLDFLNTPPIMNPSAGMDHSDNERVSTQVLIQNLNSNSQMTSIQDISLLSIDDRTAPFDPLDLLLPNTPQTNEESSTQNNQVLDSHDAIIFPNSFDESNNPFLATNPNDFIDEKASPPIDNANNVILDSINEDCESRPSSPPIDQTVKPFKPANNAFQARLMSSMSTSPGSLEFGPKRIAISARKVSAAKPAPISIKSSSSSFESVPLPETVKKSLGVRMKRVQFTNKSSENQSTPPLLSSSSSNISLILSSMTPIKQSKPDEEKYLNHIMKTENKRISMIVAEPRRTPIAGIKQSLSVVASSPATSLRSKMTSLTETPIKGSANSRKTPVKSTLSKEASLASYYTDLVLSSPQRVQESPRSNCTDSPFAPSGTLSVPLDSGSNLCLKENQWVFFRNGPSSFITGSVFAKTSKTRDTWRIKQSNGSESTVSSLEMCPIAFLRPTDEVFLRDKKTSDRIELVGPFKFKRFSAQKALTIELYRESAEQLHDCLKLTRLSIDRNTFDKIRERFQLGSQEDSQIRDQIKTLNLIESPQPEESQGKRRKKQRTINHSDPSIGTPLKKSKLQSQQHTQQSQQQKKQIFLDMKFLITLGDNKEDSTLKTKYSKLIEFHGGEVLSNLSTDHEIPVIKTFLLSNGFKRTPKFMTAIIRGVPRVHFNWIEACCNQSCFIDPSSFSNFLIEPPTGFKPVGILFKGKKFYPLGNAKFKNSWIPILRLLGATVSTNTSAKTLILAENSDEKCQVKGTYEKVVNIDWLIRCIVERSIL